MKSERMRLAWITDPHFNFCALDAWDGLVESLRRGGADAVLISGDISEGEDVAFQLKRLADALAKPIYFVLGNHDFYQGGIAATRTAAAGLGREHPLLHYLTALPTITLSDQVALIGEDGWGDATVGDFERSPVRLADFLAIDDFRDARTADWKAILQEQGRLSAERLRLKLAAAMATHSRVLVVTHVPPFREACWYAGRTTDDFWAPFFVCGQVGDVLREAVERHPACRLSVLCGHTHNAGVANLGERLSVFTAGAKYGEPDVAGWIEIAPGAILLEW
jgi:predicted phosphohydrolase